MAMEEKDFSGARTGDDEAVVYPREGRAAGEDDAAVKDDERLLLL